MEKNALKGLLCGGVYSAILLHLQRFCKLHIYRIYHPLCERDLTLNLKQPNFCELLDSFIERMKWPRRRVNNLYFILIYIPILFI